MICSACEEVSQVPTGTRIPTAFINTLWNRRLESGCQRELDLSPQGSAAASQADGNSGGEHLPREQARCLQLTSAGSALSLKLFKVSRLMPRVE
jgi:hypothetical protein